MYRATHLVFAGILFAGTGTAGLVLGYASNAQADEGEPAPEACTGLLKGKKGKFKYKEVEKACKAGGRAQAKKLMKDAVKKAKARFFIPKKSGSAFKTSLISG